MGVGRFYHPRPRPLPDHGPLYRADIQLVEPVRTPRRTGQTSGSDHQPPTAAFRHRRAQPPRPADHAEGGQLSRQGRMGGERALGHRPFPSRAYSKCGAVDRRPALAPHPVPRGPILARRAPTTRSAASYGTGLTGRTYIEIKQLILNVESVMPKPIPHPLMIAPEKLMNRPGFAGGSNS